MSLCFIIYTLKLTNNIVAACFISVSRPNNQLYLAEHPFLLFCVCFKSYNDDSTTGDYYLPCNIVSSQKQLLYQMFGYRPPVQPCTLFI